MTVTEQDRERAIEVGFGPGHRRAYEDHDEFDRRSIDAIAQALADERERARAPFLAYADRCAAIGNDPKTGIFKRATNRAVAEAFRRAAEESQ